MKMPFGKHKGVELDLIDEGYLYWILENMELSRPLERAVEEAIDRRSKIEEQRNTIVALHKEVNWLRLQLENERAANMRSRV